MTTRARITLTAALAWVVIASPASARDYVVNSFDDTPIVTHFFPNPDLKPGERTPTVLYGPGWSGAGQTNTSEASTTEQIGIAALLKAGYNVVTWDPRGFGGSGGVSSINDPAHEARDVSAILDLVAQQPESQLDTSTDPRAGMIGGSYGGGIQWAVAGTDQRIDAIVPNSSWNSLESSLFPEGVLKAGITSLLYGLGVANGTAGGLASPAGPQTGSLDPHITSFYSEAMSTGNVSKENADWFRARGPWNVLANITTPTFITQGKPDILFPVSEVIRNYEVLEANKVPLKMLWHCGGHGSCLDDPGTDGDDAKRLERETLAWLDRYLRSDKSVDTGPGFEWVSQDGVWHSAASYPLPAAKQPLAATGSGTLVLHPSPGSGTPMYAGSAPDGVNVDFPAVAAERVEIVGEPKLRLTYSGTASAATSWAYAQVVDLDSGNVVGNQATPIPLTLDGAQHTIERPLHAIAFSATPTSRLQLQIAPASAVYRQQTATGSVTLHAIEADLPATSDAPVAVSTPDNAGQTTRPKLRVTVIGRLRPGQETLRIRVRAQGEAVKPMRITLRRGHRVIGRRTIARTIAPHGRGKKLTLRLRRPLKPGSYALRARGSTASGVIVRARKALRVR